MGFPYGGYDLILRLLRATSPLLAAGESKVARGIRGRQGAVETLEEWAGRARTPDRPLVWFHAPSVGEGLQARAVLEALRTERGDLQAVFTHFSPSAEGLARSMPVEVAGYLPWDTHSESRRVLAALRPSLLVFTKTEVWPTLAREAERQGAHVVLAAATLPEHAGRLRPGVRHLLAPVFRRLDRVLAISEEDGERFGRLGVAPEQVVVTGDPGIDSARERALAADPDASYLEPFRRPHRPTLVCGSTWPADEKVLLPAVRRVREDHPGLRLLLAPHEPHEAHLETLEAELATDGWKTARLGEVEERGEAGDADTVVVDRVGVLAHLYTVGDVAFVGGGFHPHGLHSVLEPAAAGLPVIFGPAWSNARAAGDLLLEGGAREVASPEELAGVLGRWLDREDERIGIGERAEGYIRRHIGAARRTAEALAGFLPPRQGDKSHGDGGDAAGTDRGPLPQDQTAD
ncbi:MAG: glycosyltransferase N-terminal domain-containing protein [Gemmatimonadota bacterium]